MKVSRSSTTGRFVTVAPHARNAISGKSKVSLGGKSKVTVIDQNVAKKGASAADNKYRAIVKNRKKSESAA